MHFDHERIPERVVHARGAAAHGVFESYGSAAKLSRAGFLAKGVQTPVTAIRERMLQVLANVDPDLCAGVAEGLGLPAPEPTEKLADVKLSAALSQIGQSWPVTGRIVGIIVGDDPDLKDLRTVRSEIFAAGMVPLIIAPKAGMRGSGRGAPLADILTAAGCPTDAPGIVLAGTPTDVLGQLTDLLGTHRVWERC